LLKAQADCEQLDKIAAEYEKRSGQHPRNMRDLVNAGLLPGQPADAEGFIYVFGENGKTQINPASPLFKEQAIQKKL